MYTNITYKILKETADSSISESLRKKLAEFAINKLIAQEISIDSLDNFGFNFKEDNHNVIQFSITSGTTDFYFVFYLNKKQVAFSCTVDTHHMDYISSGMKATVYPFE